MPKIHYCLLLLLLLSAPLQASMEFSPKRVMYYSRDRDASLSVTNTGSETERYRVQVRPWGEPTTSAAVEMVAYPPVFTLAPGERQRVRFLLRNKPALTPPHFFRIQLQAVNDASPEEGRVRLPIRFSIPLYYLDLAEPPKAVAMYRPARPDQPAALVVRNVGATVVEIRGITTGNGTSADLDYVIAPAQQYEIRTGNARPPFTLKLRYAEPLVVR